MYSIGGTHERKTKKIKFIKEIDKRKNDHTPDLIDKRHTKRR